MMNSAHLKANNLLSTHQSGFRSFHSTVTSSLEATDDQKCFLNGSLSSNRVLSCGIPQGTILGPLLFLLYINDLPNCLMHSQPRMYADDTHLTLAGNSVDSIELNLN